jgi:ribosomal protein S18 acetylase RimI-like enzyme
MHIRPARHDDLDLLWGFLMIAAYEPDIAAAKAEPFVAKHLHGWKQSDDFGFVAELDESPVGAAWARHYGRDDNPFYVDARSPEVSIGVLAGVRRQGVGTKLLCGLIGEAESRGLRLSLNVRETNPALRLYERLGFRRIPEQVHRNRVGTMSFGMVYGEI